jgi:hypothetical protein
MYCTMVELISVQVYSLVELICTVYSIHRVDLSVYTACIGLWIMVGLISVHGIQLSRGDISHIDIQIHNACHLV